MNKTTLLPCTLTTLALFAALAGCDAEAEAEAELLAEVGDLDLDLLAEFDIEVVDELLAIDDDSDPDAPRRICVHVVPSEDQQLADPDGELETRCYDSREEMFAAADTWQPSSQDETDFWGSQKWYYLGEGFEHTDLGGDSHVFVSPTPCSESNPESNPAVGSLGNGWNDRISSYTYKPWDWVTAWGTTIYKDSGCNGVTFYEHANFLGEQHFVGLGKTEPQFCIVYQELFFHEVEMTRWDWLETWQEWSSTWGQWQYHSQWHSFNDKLSSLKWYSYHCGAQD